MGKGGVTEHAVLIAGGYGVVGKRISAELAPDYSGRIVIAGRNLARAEDAAAAIGYGARGRQLDITDPASISAAPNGVAVAVSCDQPGRKLLWAAFGAD